MDKQEVILQIVLKPGTEDTTRNALRNMSASAVQKVSEVMQILDKSVSLQEAKKALLGDMATDGESFSIVIKENFQFVVAGVLGQEQDDMLIVEVKSYN